MGEKIGNVVRSKGTGTCTHGAEVGAEILFPVRSRAPGFHACSETGSRVARLSSSRPRLPRKTSSFPELRAERKIKRIPSGACLHPSRDFRAAGVLAERLTFAFSEWSTRVGPSGNRAPLNEG